MLLVTLRPTEAAPRAAPCAPAHAWERLMDAARRQARWWALAREVQAAFTGPLAAPGAVAARPCPVCDLDDAAFAFRAPLLDFFRCAGCGLLYAPRRPVEDLVERLFWRAELGRRWRALLDDAAAADVAHRVSAPLGEMLRRAAPEAESVLQIGCGAGALLEELARRFPQVIGVETRAGLAPLARVRAGVDVREARLETMQGPFDLIVVDGVLAQVADPRGLLAQAARLLAPRGLIFARVLSGSGAALALCRGAHPAVATHLHTSLFTPSALRHAAWRANLMVRRLWTDDVWDAGALELVRLWHGRDDVALAATHPLVGPAAAAALWAANALLARGGVLSRRQAGAHLCAIFDAP